MRLTTEDKQGNIILNCTFCPNRNLTCSVLNCRNMLMYRLHEYETVSSDLSEDIKKVDRDERNY